jgi:hypothetical protein
LGHAVSHCQCSKICPNLPKIAQKLPKFAQKQNFEIPPKIEILVFLKNKNCMCRRGTKACFHHSDFQCKKFSYAIFIVKKNGLCMWISAYPLAKNDFFLNVPHLLWVWDFEDMYLTHLETRIWRGTFHIYFKKCFFLPSKLCCPLRVQGKKTFSLTLNVMILQMVRNDCVRFGGHVDIEVSYKILQLNVSKETPILHNLSCFE